MEWKLDGSLYLCCCLWRGLVSDSTSVRFPLFPALRCALLQPEVRSLASWVLKQWLHSAVAQVGRAHAESLRS